MKSSYYSFALRVLVLLPVICSAPLSFGASKGTGFGNQLNSVGGFIKFWAKNTDTDPEVKEET